VVLSCDYRPSMKKELNIVLAGQANVGKSVIFNYLTGLHQHIGNWPGKTIEKAEGTLHYHGYTINVVDLPGIYSLATYSLEELVSRDFIAVQKPDFVVNVVDGTNLERNLIFTLQILELERPTVVALNFANLLKEKRIEINYQKVEEILGIPIVPVAAIYGKGITEILTRGIELIQKKKKPPVLEYGKEAEERIKALTGCLQGLNLPYPERWLAIKLLEKDKTIENVIEKERSEVLEKAKQMCAELEKIHGHDAAIVIASERCHLTADIIKQAVRIKRPTRISLVERLDPLTCHKIWGYPIMAIILAISFLSIFLFGNWFSSLLGGVTASWQTGWEGIFGISAWSTLGWTALKSILALIEIALPYIVPFYLLLFLLEDCGYLARIAFLTDSLMHKMGIHGKGCISLMLGLGCNVPACLSCRIMETQKERLITGFLATLIPCSARTVIIVGLVGKFMGMGWALGLYAFTALIIFILGGLASKILSGEPTELIMEMPDYRRPNLHTIIIQTWMRLKEFIYIAAPIVVISGVMVEGISLLGWLPQIAQILSPITVAWLGLPAICGILLIFGILRKELILVMLATFLGTANFSQVLSPVQMLTLALVSTFYVPCIATIAVLKKEFGWKRALGIALFEIIFAITLGGIVSRILTAINIQ